MYLFFPRMTNPRKLSFQYLFIYCLLAGSLFSACKTHYQPSAVQYEQFRIQQQAPQDPALQTLIKPYADSVNQTMNQVIAEVGVNLEKKLPESNLGNLMADAAFHEAERVFGKKVDMAFINYGGIRVSQVTAGPLTLNTVFEMMPFDNLLVVQQLPGTVLQLFLDNVASRGGWPCTGIQFVIRDKKATEVLIAGQALDPAKTYTVVNSDYVANGGDDCDMLRTISQENRGFLVRDGLIHYFKGFMERGEKISATIENRVRNAD